MQGLFLGIDVGSVSTNLVLTDENSEVLHTVYLRTGGKPIPAVQNGLIRIGEAAGRRKISGVAATGSARHLVGRMTGADLIKNEITTHTVAALHCFPEVRTIMEIGGQDSKIIIIRNGVAVDFAMNTVCAAGTGSFLDQQAARLDLSIEEFGELALQAENSVAIAGRCAVFAESDMIHKQQIGHPLADIAAGLCDALVRNYLNNVGKGKEILPQVVFQGGVAANLGIRRAFEKALGFPVTIPRHYDVMGALGAALLVREYFAGAEKQTSFFGWELCEEEILTKGRNCKDCSNNCEVVAILRSGRIFAYFGDRCGKWSSLPAEKIRSEQVG
ncbi:MAG: acyl-CoA dehydratase activase [Bacillota bacterium]